jgi:peptidoglycan/xylan/chitin deacetylase (PgdA/CDA1 family)
LLELEFLNTENIHKFPELNPRIAAQLPFQEISGFQLNHLILNKGAKRQPLQQMVLGKLYIHMQKAETRSLSLTLYKNHFKMDQIP